MIVLDACVLIAHLDSTDEHHHAAVELLTSVAGDDLGASPLTLAEVMVGPARAGKARLAERLVDDLGVTEVALGPGSAITLAAMRASTGLKLPDCCVLLAAETARARLATFDDRLATVARQRGVEVLGTSHG